MRLWHILLGVVVESYNVVLTPTHDYEHYLPLLCLFLPSVGVIEGMRVFSETGVFIASTSIRIPWLHISAI